MLKRITGIKVLATTDGNLCSAFTSMLHSNGIDYDLHTRDLHHNNGFDATVQLNGNSPEMQYEIFVAKKDEQAASAVLSKIHDQTV